MVEESRAAALLDRLGLRKTDQRVRIARQLLARPGLSAVAVDRALRESSEVVSRRTIYRLATAIFSRAGCLARWDVVGPGWVCWRCGDWFAESREGPTTATLRGTGLLPLDLGGYCRACQLAITTENCSPRDGRGRSSRIDSRRVTALPIGALYENASLRRDVLGSERRGLPRDYVAALFAENPLLGPTELHRLLDAELPIAPSLRSVKRVSSALHRPEVQILFAAVGSPGWTCLSCSTWGRVENPESLQGFAPDGFVLTDLRVLCRECQASGE